MDKILIIYGSLNSVPSPEGAAPAKIIFETMKYLDNDKFQVLSNYNKKLEKFSYNRDTHKHVEISITDRLYLFFLKIRYNYRKRRELFVTGQDAQLLYFIAVSRYVKKWGFQKVIVHVSVGLVNMIKFYNPSCSVVFYHHGTSLHSKQSELQWKLLLKNTVAIFGVNQAAADFANAHFKTKLPANLYFKIGNGVEKIKVPVQYKQFPEAFQILFSGRICREKGVLELIKAYKLLKDKNYNISLIIAGDVGTIRGLEAGSKYLDTCQKYIEEHKLIVTFTGFLSQQELYKIYTEINVLILPTDPKLSLEGMSLSMLEAMSMGKPLIATNVGGNPEIIQHGYNGFLIYGTENYSVEIAARIEDIYLDKNIEKSMINNALKKYEHHFTAEKMSKNFYSALKKINYVEV